MSDENVKSVNPISARKPIKKRKPKDKPKRPLSAYNYFFKEERAKISNAVCCNDAKRQKEIDPDLTADLIEKLKKSNGKVRFEELGKLIGLRWKDISSDPERASHFASLAETDKERYKMDIKTYNEMKKHRSNAEDTQSAIIFGREILSLPTDVHHTMHAHGHQLPSPYVQHQREMTISPSDIYSGRTGYLQGNRIDPKVSQAQYPGQISIGGRYQRQMTIPSSDIYGGHTGYFQDNRIDPNVSQAQYPGQISIGGYYYPYSVTGAYAGHENQRQSNVPSHSYEDFSVTNSQENYPHSIRPAMAVK